MLAGERPSGRSGDSPRALHLLTHFLARVRGTRVVLFRKIKPPPVGGREPAGAEERVLDIAITPEVVSALTAVLLRSLYRRTGEGDVKPASVIRMMHRRAMNFIAWPARVPC